MEYALLQAFAFLRPILFIDSTVTIAGLNLFEIGAIVLFVLLILAFLINAALYKRTKLSAIDLTIIGFVSWCGSIAVIYYDVASLRDLMKFVIPPLTYIIAKNVILNRQQYLRVVFLLIMGFTVPVVVSAVLIAMGKGVYTVNYWTGIPRYLGAYTGPHNMAHNMALLIMLMAMYFVMTRLWEPEAVSKKRLKIFFVFLGGLAFYCLYMSAVRTALLGLIIFGGVSLYVFSKRLLIAVSVSVIVLAVAFSSQLVPTLFYDAQKVSSGQWGADQLGSGRPAFWENNLAIYSNLAIDQKIAGIGIGAENHDNADFGNVLESHNDFLDLLMQTGAVGLLLFLLLNYFMWRAVMVLPGKDRYIFLGLFIAVFVMNFLSNSYVARFGLGQMYYLIMVYLELPRVTESVKVTSDAYPAQPVSRA